MKILGTMTIAAAVCMSAATAEADLLYRASLSGNFDHINTSTFAIEFTTSTDSLFTLATEPGTNTIWGVTYGTGGDLIVTIDPFTGATTDVVTMLDPGDPYPYFSSLTFMPDGSLYTVATPDCGWTPGTILQINTTTGELTDMGYGSAAGYGAQALEFNPEDDLFYHFYNDSSGGGGESFLQTVDPVTGAVTPITLTGYDYNAINAVAYAGGGMFYAYDNTVGNLMSITTAGEVALLETYGGFDGHGLTMDAYIPAPGALSLLALGGMFGRRRRR